MKTPEAPALRILKIQNTRSLSGASELTYHLGCDDQDNLYIRLWGNSAGGLHSKHWFSLARILERLIVTDEKPITSSTLRSVCPGSMNNGGFILATLRRDWANRRTGGTCPHDAAGADCRGWPGPAPPAFPQPDLAPSKLEPSETPCLPDGRLWRQ